MTEFRRISTARGFVLYVDEATRELRNGPISTSSMNVLFLQEGDQGRIVYNSGEAPQDIRFLADRGYAPDTKNGKDPPVLSELFEIVAVHADLVGLRARGRFLSADPNGLVMLDRTHCLGWEHFRLLPIVEPRRHLESATNFKTIVFFNHYHSGDLFTTRGFVKSIMNRIPVKYSYAHLNHPKLCIDLVDTIVDNPQGVLGEIDTMAKFLIKEDTLFINTWVGAYMSDLSLDGHPSYVEQHRIYNLCCNLLNDVLGLHIEISEDVWDYIPTIEYSEFDTDSADDFIIRNIDRRIHLFANGRVRSFQSSVGNMADILDRLAQSYPRDVFVATEKFTTTCENIMFTDDIFRSDCDLNEISYLSTYVNLLVGKNSGPFSYSQTKSNLLDPRKIFVCLSHRVVDSLPYGLDIAADFRFSSGTDFEYLYSLINDSIMSAHKKQRIPFVKYPRPNYGSLLRSESDSRVYMIEGHVRRWLSDDAFIRMGFHDGQIQDVPGNYLASFRLGPDLL